MEQEQEMEIRLFKPKRLLDLYPASLHRLKQVVGLNTVSYITRRMDEIESRIVDKKTPRL